MPSSTEKQVIDLVAAGWKRVRFWQWEAPNGELFIGPHGAWKVLQQMKGVDPETAPASERQSPVEAKEK